MLAVYKAVQYFRLRPVIKCSYQWEIFRKSGSAAVLIAHCASKSDSPSTKNQFQLPDLGNLSHEHLIQQACTATVNSASQLLTCTLVAIVNIGHKYSEALKDQMSVMEECLSNIGNNVVQEELTDLLTAARSNADAFKRAFIELDSLMEYVEKLVITTTETSYLAGAETACVTLSERLHSAKSKMEEQKKLIKELEKELVLIQQEVIRKTSNPDDKK